MVFVGRGSQDFHHCDRRVDAASGGIRRLPNGQFEVLSFWQLLLNPWGLLQYAHNMTGAVVTGRL